MSATIIVPTYNDDERLVCALHRICGHGWRVIVAAEGSETVRKVISAFPVLLVYSFERRGKGGAIVNAVRYARTEKIVFMDSDLSTDLSALPLMVRLLDSYDLVIGSRALHGSKVLKRQCWHRRFLGHGFNWFVRHLFKIDIRDTQCGFKGFHKRAILPILESLRVKGWAFDVELIVKAYASGLRVFELPVSWKDAGSSKFKFKDVWHMGVDLLTVWLQNKMSVKA